MRGARPAQAKRRLRITVAAILCGVMIPAAILLQEALERASREETLSKRFVAQELAASIQRGLSALFDTEEARPFEDYLFAKLPSDIFNQQLGVQLSPLSSLPPKTDLPGVIGFFHIDPAGTLTTPLLPTAEPALISRLGIDMSELAKRNAIRDRLASILGNLEREQPLAKDNREAAADKRAFNGPLDQLNEFRKEAAPEEKTEEKTVVSQLAGASESGLFDMAKTKARVARKQQINALRQDEVADVLAGAKPLSEYQAELTADMESAEMNVSARRKAEAVPSAPAQDGDRNVPTRLSSPKSAPSSSLNAPSEPSPILRFEGEIDPFRAAFAGDALVFYRRVWHGGQRYLQGVAVDAKQFFDSMVLARFSESGLSQTGAVQLTTPQRQLALAGMLYRHASFTVLREPLTPPLDGVELILTSVHTGPSSTVRLIWTLGGVTLAALLAGLAAIYRLGMGQIELARSQGNFVSAVSHELKTPLTSIRMYGELLKEGWGVDDEKRRAYGDYICSESDRLSRLITNVLRVAQVENSESTPELRPRDPKDLLKLCADRLGSFVSSKGFSLDLADELQESGFSIEVDEDAFLQIITNLVDNAVKFASASPEKRVVLALRKTSAEPAEVVFSVRDFGPGIPDAELRQIFRLFYRGEDELTRTTKGTGIGLALVKELTESMKGSVDAKRMEPGAMFEVRFRSHFSSVSG